MYEQPISTVTLRTENNRYVRLSWFPNRLEMNRGEIQVEDYPWRLEVRLVWDECERLCFTEHPEIALIYDGTGWNPQAVDALISPVQLVK